MSQDPVKFDVLVMRSTPFTGDPLAEYHRANDVLLRTVLYGSKRSSKELATAVKFPCQET